MSRRILGPIACGCITLVLMPGLVAAQEAPVGTTRTSTPSGPATTRDSPIGSLSDERDPTSSGENLAVEREAVEQLLEEGDADAALLRVDRVLSSGLEDDLLEIEWLTLKVRALSRLDRSDEAWAAIQDMQSKALRQSGLVSRLSSAIENSDDLEYFYVDAILIGFVIFCLALAVFGIELAISRKQSRIGRGSRARWIGVTAACTLLGFLPLATWFLGVLVLPEDSSAAALPIAIGATVLVTLALMVTTLQPVSLGETRPLSDVETGPTVDRVVALSQKMNVSPPAVRRIPSMSSDLEAMAFMSGLPAYTLIVTDGLEQRLNANEQDAVLAHELGHIANGSLWWYMLIGPVAASAAVLLAMAAAWREVPMDRLALTFLFFGSAVAVGLKRFIGRALEYDCDRRAGAAAGYGHMASALRSIAAIGRVRETGILSWLLHATAVHPSNDERIDTLDWRAPITDLVQVPWKKEEVARRRWATRLAALLWAATLVVAAGLILSPDRSPMFDLLIDILLGVATFLPLILLLVLVYRRTSAALRQSITFPRRRRLALVIGPILLGLCVWLMVSGGGPLLPAMADREHPAHGLLFLVLAGICGVLFVSLLRILLGASGFTALDRKILGLLVSRQYEEILSLAAKNERKISRSLIGRHNVAIARALAGDRSRAIDELRGIIAEGQGPARSAICLGTLLLEQGLPSEAVEAARAFERLLPNDPAGPLLEGEAEWEQRRLDQALAAAERAGKIQPGESGPLALQARIAIARQDISAAERLLDEAEEIAPADLTVQVGRFELARAEGDFELARTHLSRIRQLVEATPVSLFQTRLERMSATLEPHPLEGDAAPIDALSSSMVPETFGSSISENLSTGLMDGR